MTARIALPSDEIAAFCERWQVVELALFGCALRDDFGPASDIDLLVVFEEEARHSLFDMVRIERELKSIIGRKVSLVERVDIERSRNYLRRRTVLEASETIYAA